MSGSSVEVVDRGDKAIARSVDVEAAAEEIFARLENPGRHHELDGSGTVKVGDAGSDRLALGQTFSVRMKMLGVPYRMTSRVVRFEQDRDIAWRHPAGHTWRWELEPLPGGGTRVTETWEYSQCRLARVYRLLGMHRRNARGIEASLRKVQQGFGASHDAGMKAAAS